MGLLCRSSSLQVVLHVGMPKCGSTSIQRHFARHAGAYARQGVVYPESHRAQRGYRSHRPLSLLPDEDLSDALWQIAYEARGARTILLSSEHVGAALPHGPACALSSALESVFGAENVTILAYFRDPVGYVNSCYAQFIVGGLMGIDKAQFFAQGIPGIARYLEHVEARKGAKLYDYIAAVDGLAAAFPGMRVNLRSLPDLPPGGLIADLCFVLGVRPLAQGRVRNTRKTTPTLLALQHVQSVSPNAAQQRALLRQFALSSAADWLEADLWHQSLHAGPELCADMAELLAHDRLALMERFATPVTRLLHVSAPPALSDRVLSAAERAEVETAFDGQN